ncbi:hypothetical protein INH39_08370 [Massilia violaceinigra]|uniref:Minor tail protein n=1 Tax=Massilia violaceinigra TaxID=2045208 RepID=A0ABY4AA77_9BURK|nr:hypothetical protein [Massilia violaceinigra]UOD31682.1 hypothetical protein INH39_08370 [Massilia violaceinigra]
MAIEIPPPITPGPVPVIQRGDRATFSSRLDAFVRWIIAGVPQFVAVAANVEHNAAEALTSATAADKSALLSKDSATASAGSAALAAAAAETANGTQLTSTSVSPLPIGNGNRTFETQAAKQFRVNVPMVAVSASDPTARMFGTVVSYTGTSLVLNITSFSGVGTVSNWNISVAGAAGPAGSSVLAGNATDAINEKRGADMVSSARPDIWAAGGNTVVLTTTDAITGFPPAPQAGATRRFIASGNTPIQGDANLVIKGGSNVLAAGDEVQVLALTTTTFRATITRADGSAVAARVVRHDAGTVNTLDFRNGQVQRWAPVAGANVLNIVNWPPAGQLGELLIEGYALSGRWNPTNIKWIKPDGSHAATLGAVPVTMLASTTVADWIMLWTVDGGVNIFGKVMR